MNTQTIPSTHITDIRHLAARYAARAIEQCMQLALADQANPCYSVAKNSETMNVLAKSGFVIGRCSGG